MMATNGWAHRDVPTLGPFCVLPGLLLQTSPSLEPMSRRLREIKVIPPPRASAAVEDSSNLFRLVAAARHNLAHTFFRSSWIWRCDGQSSTHSHPPPLRIITVYPHLAKNHLRPPSEMQKAAMNSRPAPYSLHEIESQICIHNTMLYSAHKYVQWGC